MPKKAGIIFVVVGAVLILSALLLHIYNQYEDRRAGQEAESLLADVQSMIADRGVKPTMPENEELNGYSYIGYLSIPDLELELPVMSDWDYEKLELAPCRQFGSIESDDLVIAAHNYISHFRSLGELDAGSEITVTDMNGTVNRYTVVFTDILKPIAVDEVQNSGYDLVLYTCTKGGKSRITVFCNREDETSENHTSRN